MAEQTIAEYTPSSLDLLNTKRPEQVLRLKYDVACIMDRVLNGPTPENPSGVHFGPSFPGSKKNSLLLPGAHTLASTFGLTPTYEVMEMPDGKGRRYQVRTKMYSRSGLFLGEGIGEASTEEDKFAWQEVVCDAQYAAADPMDVRIKYKKTNDGHIEIKQIRTNVADKSNTALKIGKKRSFVDAVILCLDCSDIFDQGFEELGDELGFERHHVGEPKEPRKPKERPAPVFTYGKHKGQLITDPTIDTSYLEFMGDKIATGLKEVAEAKTAGTVHARAKFAIQDQLFLAALDAEIAHRKQNQPKAEPKQPLEQVKTAPGDSRTPTPVEGVKPAMEDSPWADFIIFCEEEQPAHYKTTKHAFNVTSGHDVPKAMRWSFYEKLNGLVAGK